ncbi:MAG: hypothetical protein NW207_03465 [Cytophagales bacterium]|nr:hypothetical protein [Cytophagales bacterium]
MQIAQNINFRKAGKGFRRIQAQFTNTEPMADLIAVAGTEDFRRINKKNNIWVSRCRYNTLELTLLYIDFNTSGLTAVSVSYDKNGARIQTPSEDAVISNIDYTVTPSLDVILSWTSEIEKNIRQYTIYKEEKGTGILDTLKFAAPKGAGQPYSETDDQRIKGTFNYLVYAEFPSTLPGEYGKFCGSVEEVDV